MSLDPSAQKLEIAVSEKRRYVVPGGCTARAAKTKYLPYLVCRGERLHMYEEGQETACLQCLEDERTTLPQRTNDHNVGFCADTRIQ